MDGGQGTITLIIASIISLVSTIAVNITSKWLERQGKKLENEDEHKQSLNVRRFDQGEIMRKEMQTKIDSLERRLDRHERGFIDLRDATNYLLQETLFTLQLVIQNMQDKNYSVAEERLQTSITRLKNMQLPKLPPLDDRDKETPDK